MNDDYDPPDMDDEDLGEPIGRCDDCMDNVYGIDVCFIGGDMLCDQCAWYRSQT